MTQSREPVQKVARASREECFAKHEEQDNDDEYDGAEDQKDLRCERAELFWKRSGQED